MPPISLKCGDLIRLKCLRSFDNDNWLLLNVRNRYACIYSTVYVRAHDSFSIGFYLNELHILRILIIVVLLCISRFCCIHYLFCEHRKFTGRFFFSPSGLWSHLICNSAYEVKYTLLHFGFFFSFSFVLVSIGSKHWNCWVDAQCTQ